MKIEELMNYDFHDSLLENIRFVGENKKIRVEIDFCNWKQNNYVDGTPETLMIALVFSDVESAQIPDLKFNSDQIVGFNVSNDKRVVMDAYNDIEQDCYSITICAGEVEIIVL